MGPGDQPRVAIGDFLTLPCQIGPVLTIGEACAQVGTTARALRYREALGLLPVARQRGTHRRYSPNDLEAARLSAELEATYGVPPAALAFALRAVTDPRVRADVERLAALTGRSPVAALDFESAKGRLLLGRAR